jgi:arylsulfatase A-like enzyme
MANVALVVLDTLRKDAFDAHFDWLPGIRFENAWSTSGWTVPAHASLFTGQYASEVGVVAKSEALTCDRPVLAERFSEAGYATRAFSANAYVSEPYSYDRGFDRFETNWRGEKNDDGVVDWSAFIADTGDSPVRYLQALRACFSPEYDTVRSLKHGARIKAGDLGLNWLFDNATGASQALELVRETKFGDDEFLFLNLMEAHSPYSPPKEYRTVSLQENPSLAATMSDSGTDVDSDTVRTAYTDAVRHLSDVYREIFDRLTADFDYVVTLGDHGELFGEYGIWSHSHGVPPELVHIPLSIYRGRDEETRVEELVSLLDVHRTILELAGLDGDNSRGQDLLSSPQSRPSLTERFGLRPLEIEKHRATFGDEVINRYDTPLYGVVLPEDYYGWQTLDGFSHRGETDVPDPQSTMEELRNDLEAVEIEETGMVNVDDEVEQRLEDLGYA